MHPLRVEFKYTATSQGVFTTCNHEWWEGVYGRSNLPQKSSTVPSGSLDLACVASVSVRFRSKEQGTRVKDRTKMGQVKAFFGSHISRSAKTGLSLLRNQVETLATHASLDPPIKNSWIRPCYFTGFLGCSCYLYLGLRIKKYLSWTAIF